MSKTLEYLRNERRSALNRILEMAAQNPTTADDVTTYNQCNELIKHIAPERLQPASTSLQDIARAESSHTRNGSSRSGPYAGLKIGEALEKLLVDNAKGLTFQLAERELSRRGCNLGSRPERNIKFSVGQSKRFKVVKGVILLSEKRRKEIAKES